MSDIVRPWKRRGVESEEKIKSSKSPDFTKITLSALIKRSIKASSARSSSTAHDVTSSSRWPVPLEYIEALKRHCEINAQSNSEDSIYNEFYNVLAKELTKGSYAMASLFVLDNFVNHSEVFRGILVTNMQKFITTLTTAHLLQSIPSTPQDIRTTDYLIEIVDLWSLSYGEGQPAFLILQRYIRESLRVTAPSLEDRIREIETKRREKEVRQWKGLVDRAERVIHHSLPETILEITRLMQMLQEAFALLFPSQVSALEDKDTFFWDNLEWESDDVEEDTREEGDATAAREDLLSQLPTTSLATDLRFVIDPLQRTVNTRDSSLAQKESAVTEDSNQQGSSSSGSSVSTSKEVLQVVATAAKDALRIYQLLVKWRKVLRSFLEAYAKRRQLHLSTKNEASVAQSSVKRRRILIDDPDDASGADQDEALVTGLVDKATSYDSEVLPATLKSIRQMLNNQCRTLLMPR